MEADMILYNGHFHTVDHKNPYSTAVAIQDGKFIGVGNDTTILQLANEATQVIDLKKNCVIPGINDSHLHLIRGGLNYNLELRWDGVSSLDEALRMLAEQVARTPSPQWVRVVGGWTPFQFAERRMPTLEEINRIAPDTPVFILHQYDRALLNRAALKAVGYTKETEPPVGGQIEKDLNSEPTGLLLATPNALILYSTLAKSPKLSYEYQLNSTRHFMREMNRFGITSAIDAGGGFQNYPDDYQIIKELNEKGQLTVRIAYNLFTQNPKSEYEDFEKWIQSINVYDGDDMYRHNGAGEMIVFSAADFEDFLQPRPDLTDSMEEELARVVRLLVQNRWPFRIHATYNESITRFLNVFEKVNKEIPFAGLPFIIDHAETISELNIERVKALGGGIAIQPRMAFQGEYFVTRYGKAKAQQTPPFKQMLDMEVPLGGGSDGTRVSSYNPWLGLYWLTTGKTIGGLQLYGDQVIISRETAIELYTVGSAWFSADQQKKGSIKIGMLADLAVLSNDFFSIADEEIKNIEAILTIVGGKVVYAKKDFSTYDPEPIPVLPDWSPVKYHKGYYSDTHSLKVTDKDLKTMGASGISKSVTTPSIHCCVGPCDIHGHAHGIARQSNIPLINYTGFWGTLGCSCFAF